MNNIRNITLIAVVGNHFELGYQNRLLCHLPKDLHHFKSLTLNHTVVMGRKTWDSLPIKPLPQRRNIVLSRQQPLTLSGAEVFNSINEILAATQNEPELFIIGGASIYQLFLPLANKLHLTRVLSDFRADVYFPKIDFNAWQLVHEEKVPKEKENPYNFTFQTYEAKATID